MPDKGTIERLWSWSRPLLTTMLVVLGAALCYHLLFRHQGLKAQLMTLRSAQVAESKSAPRAQVIVGTRLSGKSDRISFPSATPIVLLSVRGDSDECAANWVWWRQIVDELHGKARFEILHLHDSLTAKDAIRVGVDPATVLSIAPGLLGPNARQHVPSLVVLSKEGVVVRVWTGVFNEGRLEALKFTLLEDSE